MSIKVWSQDEIKGMKKTVIIRIAIIFLNELTMFKDLSNYFHSLF